MVNFVISFYINHIDIQSRLAGTEWVFFSLERAESRVIMNGFCYGVRFLCKLNFGNSANTL